ncbi:DNA primase family protein [Listeria booriae]|uniref:DNA primase family protein n=1 Tax=Listeria booriae TaxID=1552123 RepID=UPI00289884F2|nr:phage/plasmid primase, P4 family [Listeria booriae]
MLEISLYKGYLEGKGKRSAEKFKERSDLLTYKYVNTLPSYVGILEDDYVMIDVDDREDAQVLYNIIEEQKIACSILQTTNGCHFYFKGCDVTANKIKWYTPIGIMIDLKLGIKNTADPLKIEGKKRKWLKQVDDHDALPKWLYPTSRSDNSVGKMEEGDGRNQALFNYILTLQSQGMSKNEIRETIRIINRFILKEPVEDGELNTILRDESFLKQSFFIKGSFQHHKFAKFLIAEHHVITIKKVLHIYKDGVYSDDPSDIEHVMIKHIAQLNKAKRQEVMSYLQIVAEEKPLSDVRYVAMKNGIFDLNKWKLENFSPSIIIKNKIPVAYVEGAYSEVTDHTLNKISCHNADMRKVLDEIFGYIMLRRNEFGKAFILTGKGSNGKSSYLKMIRQFTGESNCSALDMKELNYRFKTAELFGKLANIGDDISKEFIKDNSEFKKLTTGETVNVERKGRDPFDFNNYAKLIFSANEAPRINDNSDGLIRRLMLIPFNAKFSPTDEDYDPFISDKLLTDESMQYMLQVAIKALKRLMKNKRFTASKVAEKELNKYKIENNPILGYIDEMEPKFENESTTDCYSQYVIWCNENEYDPITPRNFSIEICRMFGYTTKNKKIKSKVVKVFKLDG